MYSMFIRDGINISPLNTLDVERMLPLWSANHQVVLFIDCIVHCLHKFVAQSSSTKFCVWNITLSELTLMLYYQV